MLSQSPVGCVGREDATLAAEEFAPKGSLQVPVEAPLWERLRSDVLRWLRRRVAQLQDAEDLASETACRAWRRFRGVTIAWRRLWAWALATARNLMLNYLRDLRRHRFRALDDAGIELLDVTNVGDSAYEAADFIQALELRLGWAECQTAAMLREGVFSNDAIAQARGVTERAARRVRASLAAKAAQLWKDTSQQGVSAF